MSVPVHVPPAPHMRFVCNRQGCLEKGVLKTAPCHRSYCEGLNLLHKAPPLPFWQRPACFALLICLVLSTAAALVLPPLLRPSPPSPQVPPPLVSPPANIHFEVETLIACGEQLLDLHRAIHIAETTSQSQFITGQGHTEIGRTPEQETARVRRTFQDKKLFDDLATARRSEMLKHSSRYLEIIARLRVFTASLVLDAFGDARSQRLGTPASTLVATELSQRHWHDNTSLDTIINDYQQRSLTP